MTMEALPTYLNFPEDTINLAGGLPNPGHTLYRAYDGTPVGYSSDCDPLTAEPQLSAWDGPDILGVYLGAAAGAATGAAMPHLVRQQSRVAGAAAGAAVGAAALWLVGVIW